MDGVWSVTDLVGYLAEIFNEDPVLNGVWIQGEISNLSQSTAGHAYFTLKDSSAQIKCVLFKGPGRGQSNLLQHGGNVLIHGRVSIYEAQGTLQLYVDQVQRAGIGALHLQFEALVARLKDEGLFDQDRKRDLPALPRRIGVVTSPQAAAFQDICRVLQLRFPAVEVVLAPTLVQGVDAPSQIVAAIKRLARYPDIDVIIVARGGGSLEDLWAFNDEAVARAIAASPIPIVTGVGHETDTTIADYAADLRAPTPSAAAAAVVPDRDELMAQVQALHQELRQQMMGYLAQQRAATSLFQRELSLRSPLRRLDQYRLRIDELLQVSLERVQHHLSIARAQLDSQAGQLLLLDPLRTLDRGFALVLDQRGRLIRDVADLHTGETVRIRMRDGETAAIIVN